MVANAVSHATLDNRLTRYILQLATSLHAACGSSQRWVSSSYFLSRVTRQEFRT
jgi:hypothetical protein